jgi:DNA-binding MarR family transcriptional regulator
MGWQIRMTAAEAGADQPTYAIEDNLGYLVNRTARLMAQMFSRRLQRHGVALAQWAILLFLYAKDGQTQRELSRVVAIEPPTVARTIDRMVRDGLVRREPHPHDGRATRIRVTPRALALRDELAAESIAGNQLAARVLSVDELETLKTLLRRVIDGLTGEENEPPSTEPDA